MDYNSASVRPRSLGSPAVSGRMLRWDSVDLTTRKSFSFKVKVNVDNCAPAQLAFRARVDGGTCTVDAEPEFTDVKRSKKSNTCAPTKAPTSTPTGAPTGSPTGSPTGAPVLPPPSLPGFCNGNGACDSSAKCAYLPTGFNGLCTDQNDNDIPDTCTPLLETYATNVIDCIDCPASFSTPTCTATASGDCTTGNNGGNTDCNYSPSTPNETKGFCYCSST